jgi:uncharacterized DUF497 family protein
VEFRWNEWNEEHLARHGIAPEEAEDVVCSARTPFPLVQSNERYLVWGSGSGGRLLQVVFVIARTTPSS